MSESGPLPPRLVEVFGEDIIARAKTEAELKNCRITDVLTKWGHLPSQHSDAAIESRAEAESKETVIQSGPLAGDTTAETALVANPDPATNPTLIANDPLAVAVTMSPAFSNLSSSEWLDAVFKGERYKLIKPLQGSPKNWSQALVLDERFQRRLHVQRYKDSEEKAWVVAQTLSQNCHPALPMIHDLGEIDDEKAAFSNTLPEKTLETAPPDMWRSIYEIADRLLPIAEALAEAHKLGLAHNNISLEAIHVGHFGELFLSGGSEDPLWKDHASKESQCFHQDVKALGLILRQLAEAHGGNSLTWPPELRAILSKTSGEDYSAVNLASDLRSFVEGKAIEGESWPLLAATRRWTRKNPRAAAVSFGVTFLLTILFIGLAAHTWQSQGEVSLAREEANASLSLAEIQQEKANKELKFAQLDTDRAVKRAGMIRQLHSLQSKAGLQSLGAKTKENSVKDEFQNLVSQVETEFKRSSRGSEFQKNAAQELRRQIRLARADWALQQRTPLSALAEEDSRAVLQYQAQDHSAKLMLYKAFQKQVGKDQEVARFLASLPKEKDQHFPILQWEAQLRPFEKRYQAIRELTDAKTQLTQLKALFADIGPFANKIQKAMEVHTESAFLAEIAGRVSLVRSGIGNQRTRTSRPNHINVAIKRLNHAALLDPTLSPRLGTVCFQFNEKYGAHQSWRFMTGDFARRVIENPTAIFRAEPIMDLMDVYENLRGFPQILVFSETLRERRLEPSLNEKDPRAHRYYTLCAVAKAGCGLKVPEPWIDFLKKSESAQSLCEALAANNAALNRDEAAALKHVQKSVDQTMMNKSFSVPRVVSVLCRILSSQAIALPLRQNMMKVLEERLPTLHPYYERDFVAAYLWVVIDSEGDLTKLLKRAEELAAKLRKQRISFMYDFTTLTILIAQQRQQLTIEKESSSATINVLRYAMLFNGFRHSEDLLIRALNDLKSVLSKRGSHKAAEALSGFDPVDELWRRRKVVSPKLHLWTDGAGQIMGGGK